MITIPEHIVRSWQSIVTTLAEVVDVPAALITKVEEPYIEIFRANESDNCFYKAGDRVLLAGHYCEEVIKTREKLLVRDARTDEKWKESLEIASGMVSYLGFPVLWPHGEVFGTLCVLDTKEHHYDRRAEIFMDKLKELVETQLALVYESFQETNNLGTILDGLSEGIIAHDMERHIQFFNRAAEEITGYHRGEVLGKDCYEVFGGPFCGGRCSFQGESPSFPENLYYGLNILTKRGEPRRVEMAVASRLGSNGQPAGVIASFRDITDMITLQLQTGKLKSFSGIIGQDRKMLQIYRQIRVLAMNDYPICITGETGTGKELVAKAIHNESRRGGGPFVPVNCAALPEGVLESELFGHVKGAFTGAVRDKKGRFELANGGTLFLDEVGDLPGVMQAKLLRVLQEGKFERVGDEKTICSDVRIISATNRNLRRMVGNGTFRDDLYYRLSVVPLELPPLRKRKNDIPLLIEHFLKKAEEEGRKVTGISKDAMSLLMEYAWPGNVRELQSAIRYALVTARGRMVQVENLPLELRNWNKSHPSRGPARKLDHEAVRAALQKTGGNKAQAARLLAVGRATLYRFLAGTIDVS